MDMLPLSVIVLFAVFLVIAIRKILWFKPRIWQIMLFGAVAVLVSGQISAQQAILSINYEVIITLFGLFVIGEAIDRSDYLSKIFRSAMNGIKSVDRMMIVLIFSIGMLSMVLMNDTLAIIGTPLLLKISKKYNLNPKMLLYSLAFSITVGSVTSPIGNPQNLLIAATGGLKSPFIAFFAHLFIPTMINLLIVYLFVRLIFREEFGKEIKDHLQEQASDPELERFAKISLALLVLLIIGYSAAPYVMPNLKVGLWEVAPIAILPILLFSKRRVEVVKNIDWSTLLFFASLFIVVQSAWDTGFFQRVVAGAGLAPSNPINIFATGIVLSQFISNVPFVALYLNIMKSLPFNSLSLLALAAGSTIAGNLTMLGAASNVIIVSGAEKRHEEGITFFGFLKIGIFMTLANAAVYLFFLHFNIL
jgi:Na+/H+ antiporter NhaD/arsenite permease-like protein